MGNDPYENTPLWPLLLVYPFTKSGREALLGTVGIYPKPRRDAKPDCQLVTCCDDQCEGLAAADGRCGICGIQFAAYITCPKCWWKQGVLNANKFRFKCWQCEEVVVDS